MAQPLKVFAALPEMHFRTTVAKSMAQAQKNRYQAQCKRTEDPGKLHIHRDI